MPAAAPDLFADVVVAQRWLASYFAKSSLTSDRSSFNSFTVASILARLKSFRGRPWTISSLCPLLRTGNEQINPCSIP